MDDCTAVRDLKDWKNVGGWLMSTTIETEGNTAEEAIEAALDKLGVDRSRVKVEIVKEESKGFLGIGAGRAIVRVSVVEEGSDKTIALIKEIMDRMGIEGSIDSIESDDTIEINITGPDLGLLIGKHGETLNAIQTVANVVARKEGAGKKITVDVEKYRKRRIESVVEIAKQAAERAVRTGKAVLLKPMSSYERRTVHVALSDNDEVYTVSEGEEPSRQVKIVPKR